jgi:hypothetical protein
LEALREWLPFKVRYVDQPRGAPVNVRQIAVISQSKHLDAGAVARAAAAVQQQVSADFGPAWGVSATITAFPTLQDMPDGFWPVVIRDILTTNDLGAHLTEAGDKPFALVAFSGSRWTITLSHEILEMLADPLGTEWITGPSPRQEDASVQFLSEVCDPCQSDDSAYTVNGDQWVSDFVTRDYYTASGPGTYTFRGKITQPRSVAVGGYLTWKDPLDGTWWQLYDDGPGLRFRNPTPDELRPDLHLRGAVDRDTASARAKRHRGRKQGAARAEKRFRLQKERCAAVRSTRAAWWQKQFDRVVSPGENNR